ncbi:MAG: DUF421 domain-containing protein [Acutalibacteraceae bacterium]|nr:DUF421 domain-containing protein [Acutalibacteraceae bacterium]
MISTIIRTTILYITITVAIRLMGKRQIGDMQPNELVITLLISEIAAIPLQDMNQPLLVGICAIFTLIVLEIAVSALALKSFFVRKLMSGRSVILIKNGVIDQQSMRDVRMSVLDLIELLRAQEVFDINDVAFAVLEVSGELSVLLKKQAQPVTVSDADINADDNTMPMLVISDGKIVNESLEALQINKNDFNSRLQKMKLKVKDVFLMTLDRDGNKNVIMKGGKV